MHTAQKRPAEGKRWAIVLSGGEGERMGSFIASRFGRRKPKQYCAFTGGRSMLEHAAARAAAAAGPERVVTVIGRGHRAHLSRERWEALPGLVIEQPGKRETGPGVLLPLTYVLARDPEATVMLLASDHFIRPEEIFLSRLFRAAELAEARPDRLVLLAARADGPETDYGWIEAGEPEGPAGLGGRAVLRFHEKPDLPRARSYQERGMLWNTMILAAKAAALWAAAARALPETAALFYILRQAVGGAAEEGMLRAVYERVAPSNFSRDVLERVPERTLVVPMEGVEWSDWGRPERVERSLASLKRPGFAGAMPWAIPASAA